MLPRPESQCDARERVVLYMDRWKRYLDGMLENAERAPGPDQPMAISYADAEKFTGINRGTIKRYADGELGKKWDGPKLETLEPGKVSRISLLLWATAYAAKHRRGLGTELADVESDEDVEQKFRSLDKQ